MEVFYTSGTCSRQIIFTVDENDTVRDLRFMGGCAGNAQGIAKLVSGMKVDEVIEKLSGIICRAGTSCPDQLSKALVAYKNKQAALAAQANQG